MSKLPETVTIQPVNTKGFESDIVLTQLMLAVERRTKNKFTMSAKTRFYMDGNNIHRVKHGTIDMTPIVRTSSKAEATKINKHLVEIKKTLANNTWLNFKANFPVG